MPPRQLNHQHASYLTAQGITEPVYRVVCESITAADQLPPELRWGFERSGPGIAFHHTRPDGSSAVQFRPDKPTDDRKYLWAEGVGAVLSVHPTMADRIGTATRLVIVEGTKQGLVAVSYAQPGDLIVSIQGCWSWSSEGLPVRGWDALVTEGLPVVISLDADWTTKRSVWDAADRLGGVLSSLGAGSVSYVRLPAGSNTGLDDYLQHVAAEKRAAVFARLLDSAKAKLGRRPAMERKRPEQLTATTEGLAPVVDVAAGVIRKPDTTALDDFGSSVQTTGDVLLEAAVVIERTVVIRDDLRQDDSLPVIQHDVAVYIGRDAKPIRLPGIPDDMLGDVRSILGRDPSARGSKVVARPGPGVSEAIGAAIRATAEHAEVVTAYRRTGWVALDDGTRGYLHAGGCLTADGNREWPRAQISYRSLDLSDAAARAQDPAQLMHALTEVAKIPGALRGTTGATGYYAALGGLAYVSSGNDPRGGVYLYGDKGSGKTTIARVVASFLNPAFGPRSKRGMVSMQSSAITVGDGGAGLEHTLCLVDDVRSGTTRRDQDKMWSGIDAVMRRAYEGGSVGRARTVWDAKAGTARVVEADQASPFMLMVGEAILPAEQFGSSVERVLTVHFPVRSEDDKATVAREEQAKLDFIYATAEDGLAATAYAGYIMWLASFEDIAEEVRQYRSHLTAETAAAHPSLSYREAEVAAGPMAGWSYWCDYQIDAVESWGNPAGEKACEEVERALAAVSESRDVGQAALTAAMLRHSQVEMTTSTGPSRRVLDKLAEVIASGGRWKLLGTDDQGRETTTIGGPDEALGKRTTVVDDAGERVQVLALLPGAVAKAVREPSGQAVTRALRDVAVLGPDGMTTRTMRFGGAVTRVVCIPISLWDGIEEPAQTTQTADSEPIAV